MKQKRSPLTTTVTRLSITTLMLGVFSFVGYNAFETPNDVYAAPQSQYQDQINSLQDEIATNQREVERLQGEANNLQNAIAVIVNEKNVLQSQIDLSQAKYEQLKVDIASNEVKITKNQTVLSDTVGDLYIENDVTPIEMIASSKNIGDFIDKQEYGSGVRDQLQSAIDQIKTLKEDLEKQESDVIIVLAEQTNQKDQLVAKEVQQNNLLERTRGEEDVYQSFVASLSDQKIAAEAALAASLSSGSYRQAPAGPIGAGDIVGAVGNTGLSSGPHLHLEVRSGGAPVNPVSYIGNWQPPGDRTQRFGESPEFYGSNGHPGIDYGAAQGTPIRAIASGNMYRGCSGGADGLLGTKAYGYVAIVEHTNGTISIYAHMSGGPAECEGNTYNGGL